MKIKINNISRFLFLSILVFTSCTKFNINDKFIKEIAIIDNDKKNGPIAYIPEKATNLLYLKLNNGKMICTNSLELQSIYVNYYKKDYQTFYAFLDKVLNQKININSDFANKIDAITFDLEEDIVDKSNEMIQKKYFDKNNDKYYFYPKNLPLNERQTILYKMFIDNYLISFDDYGGKYIITKYK
jgi:hypothetical protein